MPVADVDGDMCIGLRHIFQIRDQAVGQIMQLTLVYVLVMHGAWPAILHPASQKDQEWLNIGVHWQVA